MYQHALRKYVSDWLMYCSESRSDSNVTGISYEEKESKEYSGWFSNWWTSLSDWLTNPKLYLLVESAEKSESAWKPILDVFLTEPEPDMSDNEPADGDLSGGGNRIPKLRNMPQEMGLRTRAKLGQVDRFVDSC